MKVLSTIILMTTFLLPIAGCQETPVSPAINDLPPKGSFQTDFLDSIHNRVKTFPEGTELSIAIIKSGSTEYYGILRQNDTLRYLLNDQSVFEIGSISKVFTSTLLAGYVINNEIGLDDDINDYLDIKLNDNIRLTFKELSNHTSGLPRMPSNILLGAFLNPSNPYKNYDEEKLSDYLVNDLSLSYEKGIASNYSNLGAGLLSYALSKKTGSDYQRMLKKQIFAKYEMNQSTTIRKEISDQLVPGLDKNGDHTSNWDLGAMIGAGGILSSTRDLSKFAFAQFDSTNLELKLTQKVTFKNSEKESLGLGWFILDYDKEHDWLFHNGRTGGYSSIMILDIESKNAVIILSNVAADHPHSRNIDDMGFNLLNQLSKSD